MLVSCVLIGVVIWIASSKRKAFSHRCATSPTTQRRSTTTYMKIKNNRTGTETFFDDEGNEIKQKTYIDKIKKIEAPKAKKGIFPLMITKVDSRMAASVWGG